MRLKTSGFYDSSLADTHRYWLLTRTDDCPEVMGWTNDDAIARGWADVATVLDRSILPAPFAVLDEAA